MNTYIDDSLSLPAENFGYETVKERAPFTIALVIAFIIMSLAVDKIAALTIIVKILGVLLVFTFAVSKIGSGLIISKEIMLYWFFTVWTITGFAMANLYLVSVLKFLTLLQFCVMILIIANYSSNLKCVSLLFWGFLIGSSIIIVSAYLSGDYKASEYQEGTRVAGLAVNSNFFAMLVVSATAVILYFFRTWKRWFFKLGLLGIIVIFAHFVIASGSRKGFIAFVMLIFLWSIKTFSAQIKNNRKLVIFGIIFLAGLGIFLAAAIQHTTLATRFGTAGRILEGASVDKSLYSRFVMYGLGWEMFLSSPIFGIGLDQFRVKTSVAGYSHSNYMEILLSTGFVGGVLYYLIFGIILVKARKLKKYFPLSKNELEFLYIIQAFTIMHLVLDMVVVSYYEKKTWILFAIFIGWMSAVKKKYTLEVESIEQIEK